MGLTTRKLEQAIENAGTYDEWKEAAQAYDAVGVLASHFEEPPRDGIREGLRRVFPDAGHAAPEQLLDLRDVEAQIAGARRGPGGLEVRDPHGLDTLDARHAEVAQQQAREVVPRDGLAPRDVERPGVLHVEEVREARGERAARERAADLVDEPDVVRPTPR